MDVVNTEQIKMARKTCLFDFLQSKHSEEFTEEYGSLRLKGNHSLSIKTGYCGYKDFGTGETGNSIDFLVKYMEYDFVMAVRALCDFEGFEVDSDNESFQNEILSRVQKREKPDFPPKSNSIKVAIDYFEKRGIYGGFAAGLRSRKLLYVDEKNNLVFVNKEKTWGEIRGTNEKAELRCRNRENCDKKSLAASGICKNMFSCGHYRKSSFHGIIKNSACEGFWAYRPDPSESVESIYICEAAIDALSLYELQYIKNQDTKHAMYVSIGGAGKQKAIERIKKMGHAVLCVDNDEAGDACRAQNLDIPFLIPNQKDWNEDLQQYHRIMRAIHEQNN